MPRSFVRLGFRVFTGFPRLVRGSGSLNRSNAWMRMCPISLRDRIASPRTVLISILQTGPNGGDFATSCRKRKGMHTPDFRKHLVLTFVGVSQNNRGLPAKSCRGRPVSRKGWLELMRNGSPSIFWYSNALRERGSLHISRMPKIPLANAPPARSTRGRLSGTTLSTYGDKLNNTMTYI